MIYSEKKRKEAEALAQNSSAAEKSFKEDPIAYADRLLREIEESSKAAVEKAAEPAEAKNAQLFNDEQPAQPLADPAVDLVDEEAAAPIVFRLIPADEQEYAAPETPTAADEPAEVVDELQSTSEESDSYIVEFTAAETAVLAEASAEPAETAEAAESKAIPALEEPAQTFSAEAEADAEPAEAPITEEAIAPIEASEAADEKTDPVEIELEPEVQEESVSTVTDAAADTAEPSADEAVVPETSVSEPDAAASAEEDEPKKKASKNKLIKSLSYTGLMMLFSIPVIGWLCLIVFCLSKKNKNRVYFSRGYLLSRLLSVAMSCAILFGAYQLFLVPRISQHNSAADWLANEISETEHTTGFLLNKDQLDALRRGNFSQLTQEEYAAVDELLCMINQSLLEEYIPEDPSEYHATKQVLDALPDPLPDTFNGKVINESTIANGQVYYSVFNVARDEYSAFTEALSEQFQAEVSDSYGARYYSPELQQTVVLSYNEDTKFLTILVI